MTTFSRLVRPLFAVATLSLLLAAAGCDDPAKNATKATASAAVTPNAATPAPASATTYDFDQRSSKVGWVGSKVTGKHEGGFGTFKGTVTASASDITQGRVSVEIDTASITSDTEKLTGHLKSGDFFDVAKFPKATFVSTKIAKAGDKVDVTGNLTLHGVTKSITFPAKVNVTPDAVDVDAEFSINRKDFGVSFPGMKDDLIRDDVVIKLEIRGKKSQA